ncbi:MAG TPA: glycerol-3-phosphate 1-O-acyltransferase PlsY [Clostridia bacterium]|nr:glycerol-3-phosphate 1-O-acyltransferase PlsY [Clostridia bacterium]
MGDAVKTVIILISAYIIGSIPFALIVGKKIGGIDVRNYGSGNLGGTNAFRILGWKVGVPVIVADILKGMLATYLGLRLGGETLGILAGIAAAVGHCYPLFANFKGGKGVAVGAGIFLIVAPKVILLAAVMFLLTLFIFRYVSLSSIVGALTVGLLTFVYDQSLFLTTLSWLLVIFVIYRHRSNIKRILNGTENKVGYKR